MFCILICSKKDFLLNGLRKARQKRRITICFDSGGHPGANRTHKLQCICQTSLWQTADRETPCKSAAQPITTLIWWIWMVRPSALIRARSPPMSNTSCNLLFSFWSNPAVQRKQQCFIKGFETTCSAKAMREILAKYSVVVKDRLRIELQDRLFGVMFESATRQNRRFLGIAVQFIQDWYVEIRYLDMKEIIGVADADCIVEGRPRRGRPPGKMALFLTKSSAWVTLFPLSLIGSGNKGQR